MGQCHAANLAGRAPFVDLLCVVDAVEDVAPASRPPPRGSTSSARSRSRSRSSRPCARSSRRAPPASSSRLASTAASTLTGRPRPLGSRPASWRAVSLPLVAPRQEAARHGVRQGLGRLLRRRDDPVEWLTPGEAAVDWVKDFTERFPLAYLLKLEDFAQAIRHGRPAAVTGEDCLVALVLALACERSVREGRSLRVDELRGKLPIAPPT